MAARIVDIAFHLPQRIETNDDLLAANPDWRMDEVYAKSGIAARHIAAPEETASDLGYQAGVNLFARAAVDRAEVDALLYCTQSPDYFLPPAACLLQHRLGLGRHVAAFDINLGCSGFVYGLQVARCLIDAGAARHVLLITADTYTKYLHPRDRTVRTLFGDGAAATLIGPASAGPQLGAFILGSDGSGADRLIVPSGGLRRPRTPETAQERTDEAGCTRSQDHLFMDGPAIFTFAISTVPKVFAALLQKTGRTLNDIDWCVYHQANKYMLEQLARRSKIPPEKMVIDMEDLGNTVSASIPIALARHVAAGRIVRGQRLILMGFGVGLSWGACDLVWG